MENGAIKNFTITYQNAKEYQQLKKEIFDLHSYYFETDNPFPLIIDVGAHIGLSVLYFKMNYPGSTIVAVEPTPDSFKLLKQNCEQNFIENTTFVQKAISVQPGEQTLYLDNGDQWYSTASFIKGAWTKDQPTIPIKVAAIRLFDLIHQYADRTIDLLKMDIEGAEFGVLTTAGAELRRIRELIIEYHPQPQQDIQVLVKHLSQFGLKLETELPKSRKKPNQLLLLHFINNKHPSS